MKIGAIVNTPQGVGWVSGIVPGSRQVGGEAVQQAEVQVGSARALPQDQVSLSEQARQRMQETQSSGATPGSIVNTPQGPSAVVRVLPGGEEALTQPLAPTTENQTNTNTAGASSATGRETPVYRPPADESEMSPEAREALRELQGIDRAVRTEEKTHAGVAGAYGSTPEYTYVRGPDGRQYAVGGSVSVDTSSAVTPEQAERAAGAVAAAAASVNTPSSADFAAVAQANGTQENNRTVQPLVRPDDNTANPNNEQEAEPDRYDPMAAVRETAEASYNSWNRRPAGARLDIAA